MMKQGANERNGAAPEAAPQRRDVPGGAAAAPRVAVAGSLNMDLVISMGRMPLAGETISGSALHTLPGGKGANQAAGCARLGAATEMIGRVGEDAFGKQLLEQMRRMGVGASGIGVHPSEPTGVASIYHTPEDNCIVIVADANGECGEAWVESRRESIEGAQALLVQLEIPLEGVRAALRIAREAGVATVLNPAPAQQLPRELLELADYITPNETEFAALTGASAESEDELREAIAAWQASVGGRVIVTRGAAGCSFVGEDGRLVTVPAPRVEVVDTTGAGDTLNAALCVKLAELAAQGAAAGDAELLEALRFAVQAASLAVTRFGAQDGLPSREEVEAALQQA
ncbi:Ribokinase [Paenibacillus pasadenensis]|uniref:Ribokinase n=1 Tax=Paenibacillus pasadenensis TaxID=217090 RepID=A0A2N5N2C8_9BACL|nr:ribokinase [Paenibacillus pasadenensis]PLT44485.1 Ribokinase [Paenibacillus pasadenensis]